VSRRIRIDAQRAGDSFIRAVASTIHISLRGLFGAHADDRIPTEGSHWLTRPGICRDNRPSYEETPEGMELVRRMRGTKSPKEPTGWCQSYGSHLEASFRR
jgi:hypothetical protein